MLDKCRDYFESKYIEQDEEGRREREALEQLQKGGLPQGAATSPLLTIFNKNYTVLGLLDHIMYADDGLLIDVIEDLDPRELNNEEHGIEVNLEKSGWVKKDGKWLKPLKFLGLIYDGETLRGSTRKGSKLTIGRKWELVKDEVKSRMVKDLIEKVNRQKEDGKKEN